MKPSGIEWIGDIPDDWEVRKLLSLFKEHKDRNKNLEEQNLLSLSYGKIKRKDINNNDGLLPASFETYNIVENGDIVFRLTDLQNDKRSLRTGIVTQRGIITSAYVTIRPKIKLDSRFYHYLYHMYDICKVFYGMGDGVRQGMGFEDLKNIPTLIPPLKTQQRIADYLDDKCGEIDATISKQKEIIEKLKAYKQSLISETVTKGLDKSSPLKPSGIEWIGDIPDDWEIRKVKNTGKLIGGSGFPEEYQGVKDEKIPFIKVKSLAEDPISRNGKDSISESIRSKLNAEKFIKGSVVFAKVGAALLLQRFRILEFDSCIDNNMMGFIPLVIEPRFFKYVTILFDFSYFVNPGTVPSINQEQIGNIKIPFPPLKSQEKIADYLDGKCSQIDKYITEKQNIIQKLDAYKKSIVFESVTGKREIL